MSNLISLNDYREKRQQLELAIDILTERAARAGFSQRQTGQWWWKKKQLITPAGYADHILEGLGNKR